MSMLILIAVSVLIGLGLLILAALVIGAYGVWQERRYPESRTRRLY